MWNVTQVITLLICIHGPEPISTEYKCEVCASNTQTYKRDVAILERAQPRTGKGLEHLLLEGKDESAGIVVACRREGLERASVCRCLKGGREENRARLTPVVPSDGARGNGHKL